MVCKENKLELLEFDLCEPVVKYEQGTVGAMVDYIIERIHAGDKTRLLEVFKDVQKIVAKQYNVNEEEINLRVRIKDLES